MGNLRAGLIGCGYFGQVHAEALSKLTGMDMVAFCDVVPEQAEKLLAEFGGDYATDDVERLFRDSSLDAIYIATHHDSHAEYCVRAMESGKHVLVEKPLAITVEDCLRVGETVKRTGRKLMTAFKMRYYEMLHKAKELIPDPIMLTMQMMDDRWDNLNWANDPIKGGGNVQSQGCHSCDIMRFMAGGDPLEVYAAGGNYYQKTGVIDNLSAVFRFDNDVIVNWVQGDSACPPLLSKFFMQLYAEGKSITLTDRLTKLIYCETGKDPVTYQGTETGIMEENRAFIRCLQEDTEPPISHVDGLYATLMPLQAIASLKSGKPEPVKPLLEHLLAAEAGKEGK